MIPTHSSLLTPFDMIAECQQPTRRGIIRGQDKFLPATGVQGERERKEGGREGGSTFVIGVCSRKVDQYMLLLK